MWLHGALQGICWAASRSYYRYTIAGADVPATGPVLLVANHQNSLVDAAMVVMAARRPVRFLAKSTLFTDPRLGWLVRGVAAIPVYRQQDDPTRMGENLDSFRAVHDALTQGDAVGIFPEGISHRNPSLTPLKSGASRIALGAAARLGGSFPIVPIGLVFLDQKTFRSEARVVVGEPFAWADLAARGDRDREAVRELTRRIASALRDVTVNLESWADEGDVRFAEAVWTAEFGAAPDPAAEVRRLQLITAALRRLREDGDAAWQPVARELRAHRRMLARLQLTPATLHDDPTVGAALRWALHRLPALALAPVAVLGWVVGWVPQHLTATLTDLISDEGPDALPTYRILLGFLVYAAWFILLGAGAGWQWGVLAGAAALLLLPAVAVVGILAAEWREVSLATIRRFVNRRILRGRVDALRARQRDLGAKLDVLYSAVTPTAAP